MNILLVFPGFIIAFVIVICYEYKIKRIRRELRNNVRFYVTCESNYRGEIIRTLWLGKPYYTKSKRFASGILGRILAINNSFIGYNLNCSDFEDMEEGEIREVFINLED